MNTVTVSGWLHADPVIEHVGDLAVCELQLATEAPDGRPNDALAVTCFGRVAFTASERLGVGDYVAQTQKCLENMRDALAAAGADITDVISTQVLVASTRRADLVTAWNVVGDAFGTHDVPSTPLGATVLGCDDQLASGRR